MLTPTPPMPQPNLPPLLQPPASQSPAPGNTGFQNRGAAPRNFGGFPSLGTGNPPPPLMSLPVNPSNPNGLATVRITGRVIHQPPGTGVVNWNR